MYSTNGDNTDPMSIASPRPFAGISKNWKLSFETIATRLAAFSGQKAICCTLFPAFNVNAHIGGGTF